MTTVTNGGPIAPTETWFRDEHALGPLPPLQWGRWVEPMEAGFARSMERYGLPIQGLQYLRHRGWVYTRMAPLTDPAAVADRVATRLALGDGTEAAAAQRWLEADLPGWAVRRRALRAGAEARPDAELADAILAVGDGLVELVGQRFSDIAIGALLGRWVAVAAERLGLDEAGALTLVGGAPTSATSVLRAVRSGRASAGEIEVALAEHGDLLLGSDVLSFTLAERRDLLAGGAAAGSGSAPAVDVLTSPTIDDPVAAQVLADARLAVQWRESTHEELCAWLGSLRVLGLEAGRRLAARGDLPEPELALYVTVDDLVAGLRGAAAGVAARAESQREAHLRAVDDPPPPLLGPPPAGPHPSGPPLPAPVAAAIGAMAWVGQRISSPPGPPQVDRGGVVGAPGAPGSVTGPVRVIVDLAQLEDLQPGEVLVCPMTAPGWDLAFSLAAAVVCDTGGIVSHAALLAREVGVPAVVGTKVGTKVLQTGQVVVVDGAAGTVRPA